MRQLVREIVVWFMAFMGQQGYPAVLGALFLEGAWFPITSEVFFLAAGFLVWQGKLNLMTVAILGALGFSLGAFVPYSLGRFIGEDFLIRYGKYVFLTAKDIAKVRWWFQRYGDRAVLLTRCVPVVRNVISFPAGMARLSPWRFWAYSFFGFIPWTFLVTLVGYLAGANWPRFRPYFNRVDDVMLTIMVVAAAGTWYGLYRRRGKKRG